ncbi:MAG: hypothetical protein COA79_16625 [Planctomycetota bacterium]|nr:MAG: hypothetical protein COA79_16625 [Planctomycetota bacterium]
MPIDKAQQNEAFKFCQIAIENAMLEQSQADVALEYFNNQEGKYKSIEDVVKKFDFIEEKYISHLKTAISRLVRDTDKDEVQIPGYRILSKIGDGGLGTVYKAKQLSMNRNVAMKVLHPKWLSDDEFKQRFLLEARLVGKMSHPNLLQIYDVNQVGQYLYFTMEYIDGVSVEDIVDTEGAIPPLIVINIAIQVIEALDYILQFDVVHRDVKPGNILLAKEGIAKLGDFGFLKSKYDESIQTEGQVLGTPDYIAPEQAMGHDIDFKADLYSLGVTMYHMLVGELPYSGSVSTIIRKHIDEKPEMIDKKLPSIPKSLANIVYKMMEKKASNRHVSFAELKQELIRVKLSDEIQQLEIEEGRAVALEHFISPPNRDSQFVDVSLFKIEKQLLWARIFLLASALGNVILLYYILSKG